MKDHGDAALVGRHVVDALAVEKKVARGDGLESRDQAQQRGLAATARADKHGEIALRNLEPHVLDDLDGPKILAHVFREIAAMAYPLIPPAKVLTRKRRASPNATTAGSM